MPRLSDEEVLDLFADRNYPKGRRRFILVNGILVFGIPMFAVMNVFEWYSHQFHFDGIWLISWLIFSLGFCCAVGCVFGLFRWRSIERRALRSSRQ